MKKYYYTLENMGPMDGVGIKYICRFKTLKEAKNTLEDDDALDEFSEFTGARIISESRALQLVGNAEWENDVIVLSYDAEPGR